MTDSIQFLYDFDYFLPALTLIRIASLSHKILICYQWHQNNGKLFNRPEASASSQTPSEFYPSTRVREELNKIAEKQIYKRETAISDREETASSSSEGILFVYSGDVLPITVNSLQLELRKDQVIEHMATSMIS